MGLSWMASQPSQLPPTILFGVPVLLLVFWEQPVITLVTIANRRINLFIFGHLDTKARSILSCSQIVYTKGNNDLMNGGLVFYLVKDTISVKFFTNGKA